MNVSDFSLTPAGESAILIQISGEQQKDLSTRNDIISSITNHLLSIRPTWLGDLIPSFDTLLVNFDSFKTDHFTVINLLQKLLVDTDVTRDTSSNNRHQIPVYFGSPQVDYPIDLKDIAKQKSMAEEAFVSTYCKMQYRVFAVGFLPNFAYMGELASELETPRLMSPRSHLPKGAVAIADRQTAIYPEDSAGGWNILGYTPKSESIGNDIVFSVGDFVQFYSIPLEDYERMKG